jgi:calcium-dependent protein kinase
MSRPVIPVKRQWFITSNTDSIEAHYTFKESLGAGAYGSVVRATHNATGAIRAVKQVMKSRVKDFLAFKTEFDLLRTLDHPNIVRVIETFETSLKCYLVLECCEGGELFDYITARGTLTEAEAARIMRQLFSAVSFVHSHQICHRDLKPENCLLMSKEAASDVKIIDFGLAQRVEAEELMHSLEGTPYYIAPEVLDGSYGKEVDCWSLGVILYIMLSGTPPFNGRTTDEILHKIRTGYLTFKPAAFKKVSEGAKDLISQLLRKDTSLRVTAAQAYNHFWIQGSCPYPQEPLSNEVLTGIRRFIEANGMKKMALHFIATRISEKDVNDLRSQFQQMDSNGDGTLTKDEIGRALNQLGKRLDSAQLTVLCSVLDTNQDGKIEYTGKLLCRVPSGLYADTAYREYGSAVRGVSLL